mgnify:CR=1 FL=1
MTSPVLKRVIKIVQSIEGEFNSKTVKAMYDENYTPVVQSTITSSISRLFHRGKLDSPRRGVYSINRFGLAL